MEYYLAVKKEKKKNFTLCENIILTEIRQSEKAKYHMISLICAPG